ERHQRLDIGKPQLLAVPVQQKLPLSRIEAVVGKALPLVRKGVGRLPLLVSKLPPQEAEHAATEGVIGAVCPAKDTLLNVLARLGPNLQAEYPSGQQVRQQVATHGASCSTRRGIHSADEIKPLPRRDLAASRSFAQQRGTRPLGFVPCKRGVTPF